jgi:hypothetical protein
MLKLALVYLDNSRPSRELASIAARSVALTFPVLEYTDDYPDYSPTNQYTVRLDLSDILPTRLAFSLFDCGCFDNSGTFEVRLETVCEP